MESNDSPEIPDRGETSDIPVLPSGDAPGSKRKYPCTQTASAVQKYFPVCFSFVPVIASDMHLEAESAKRAKNVDFHTAKNSQTQPTLFRSF